jgi:hypothetical protein
MFLFIANAPFRNDLISKAVSTEKRASLKIKSLKFISETHGNNELVLDFISVGYGSAVA